VFTTIDFSYVTEYSLWLEVNFSYQADFAIRYSYTVVVDIEVFNLGRILDLFISSILILTALGEI
jgi:hypothetical protein